MCKLLLFLFTFQNIVQNRQRKREVIEDYEEEPIVLDKLETKDTDPKILNKKILAPYFDA